LIKRVMAFIDGENLFARFQDMLGTGSSPMPDVIHAKDCFVWSPRLTLWTAMDLRRVNYYTSVVGDETRVREVAALINGTFYRCDDAEGRGHARLIPRVHKKPSSSKKTKVVDIDISIDVMNAIHDPQVDAIFLVSGDGDFAPLVREAGRTSKQVFVGAFSSGLAPEIQNIADQFQSLDGMFFKPTA
jgi:uncharacterized LabA/DUF88 family protein